MESELFYRIALTRVPHVGPFRVRILFSHFGQAAAIFRATPTTLAGIKGVGWKAAMSVGDFNEFREVEKEMKFLEKYRIRALFFTDPDYPKRLEDHKDAPALLYYKGTADLNAAKIVTIVGTRTPTEYGKQVVERIVSHLCFPDLLVVSGLAYGIDTAAHTAALRCHLPTVAVLGHGLDRISPEQNTALAREMAGHGGLLTEFGIGTKPLEYHFPMRNRIIAGICQALIVIETGSRGGSMVTVGYANKYRKKVFAVPGRITDKKSAGCNELILLEKARTFTGVTQFIKELDWGGAGTGADAAVDGLSVAPKASGSSLAAMELSSEERALVGLLRHETPVSIDELLAKKPIAPSALSLVLLELELRGIIRALPGKRFLLQSRPPD